MPTDDEQRIVAGILAQVFRDSPLPTAIYDAEGNVWHANDAHHAFASALGDATGVGDFNALTDLRSERGGHRKEFLRALSGVNTDYAFDVRSERDPGPEPELEFRRVLLPARDDQGCIVGVVSIVVDVSDWLRAERDNVRLQTQLVQAQKAESLGLLAGGIAHDFNNLLMGVLGNASLLIAKLTPGSELRRLADAVQLSAQRAADVARQLLAYAGKGRFRIESIELSELVRETAEILRITVAGHGELVLELEEDLGSVRVDVTQLRQVVMNLITNARDAIAKGGGRITVRTGQLTRAQAALDRCQGDPSTKAKEFAFVEVEDTGVGMDTGTLGRIFDPFYTTKVDGRGLGLSAVMGIVRSHGGALHVESAPGRGTRMRILLPVESASDRPRLRTVPPPSGEPSPRPCGGKVLVVDDQQAVRHVLGDMLEAMDYRAVAVPSGAEALEVLATQAQDACCVLLDLTIPGEEGSHTLRRLRERHPHLPVVLMSGYEDELMPATEAFLHKPFTMGELDDVLAKILG